MTTLEHSLQNDLLPMELPLTLSPVDSRAKTLALLESKPELGKARAADCGANACVLLAKYDPNTQFLRMSQTCFLDRQNSQAHGLQQSYETWPRSGIMLNGMIYLLPMLVPGTAGGEFGYLPTPTKSDAKGAPKNRYFRSKASRGNLCENLRNGLDDPIYPHPDFVTQMMGFPTGWLELRPLETP
jgi:hypothetical protein